MLIPVPAIISIVITLIGIGIAISNFTTTHIKKKDLIDCKSECGLNLEAVNNNHIKDVNMINKNAEELEKDFRSNYLRLENKIMVSEKSFADKIERNRVEFDKSIIRVHSKLEEHKDKLTDFSSTISRDISKVYDKIEDNHKELMKMIIENIK